MADISNIKIDDTTYDIKDSTARTTANANSDIFQYKIISQNITVSANGTARGTFGTVTIPDGYTLLEVNHYSDWNDTFLIDFGIGKSWGATSTSAVTIYYCAHSTYGAQATKTIRAIATFIKTDYFTNHSS